mgnify:CR=1 FL=1
MPEERRSPLHATASLLVFCAVAYRVGFSGVAGGFQSDGLGDLILFGAMTLYLLSLFRRDAPSLGVNLASGAFILFVLTLFITARTSVYPRGGVPVLANMAALACLLTAVSGTLFGRDDSPRAAAFLAALAAAPLAVGLFQHYWEFPRLLADLETLKLPGWVGNVYIDSKNVADFRTRVESAEVFSTFTWSNVFAGYLALTLAVTVGLGAAIVAGSAPKRRKVLGATVTATLAAIEAALLVWTKSKAGRAAALVGMAILAALVLYRLVSRKMFLIILAVCLVLGSVALPLGLPRAKQFYAEAMTSLDVRFGYWRATWRMIEADVFTGVGPGNFAENYVSFKDIGEREVKDPHNAYLLVWAEGGVFSLLFFAAFWVFVFAGRRSTRPGHAPPGWGAAAAVGAALLMYLAVNGSFAGDDAPLTLVVCLGMAIAGALVILLWIVAEGADTGLARAGLAAGVAAFAAHAATDITFSQSGGATAAIFAAAALSPRGKSALARGGKAGSMLLAGVAALALVLFAGKIYVPYTQAELAMSDATFMLSQGDAVAAAERAREATALDPKNTVPPTFLGRLYEQAAKGGTGREQHAAAAQAFFCKAIELDSLNRAAHEGLTRLYVQGGPESYDEALTEYATLLMIYPTNSQYCIGAAGILEKVGRPADAVLYYRQALAIDDKVEQHGIQLTKEERAGIEAAIRRIEESPAMAPSGAD